MSRKLSAVTSSGFACRDRIAASPSAGESRCQHPHSRPRRKNRSPPGGTWVRRNSLSRSKMRSIDSVPSPAHMPNNSFRRVSNVDGAGLFCRPLHRPARETTATSWFIGSWSSLASIAVTASATCPTAIMTREWPAFAGTRRARSRGATRSLNSSSRQADRDTPRASRARRPNRGRE